MDEAAQALAGKRVFVTGATGFIGGHLTHRLHAIGAEPVALERTPGKGDDLREAGITVVRGDIVDDERMREILSEGIDIVMHIAAWLSGRPYENYERVNVAATRHLAEASATAGVGRFVYTSTIMVYGAQGDKDVDESEPITPYGDPYGDSKIRSEAALWEVSRETGLEVAMLRPGMVYGPGSRGWTVRTAKWAKAGRTPIVDGGRGTAFPIYVGNLVDMLLLCATHPEAPGEAFNAVDDGPVTLGEYFGAHMAMVPTTQAIRLPGWLLTLGATVLDPFLPAYNYRALVAQMRGTGQISNRKAHDVLGWQQRLSLEEGLRITEHWLREKGILDEVPGR